MERPRIVGIVLCGLSLGLMGCASDQARYVYQDRESGLIAIAKKTTQIAKASAKNSKDDSGIPTAGPIKALSPPSLGGKGIADGSAWTPW